MPPKKKKSTKGKTIPKRQLDHTLFKFMDKKWLKERGISHFESFTVANNMLDRFIKDESELSQEEVAKLLASAVPDDDSKTSKSKSTKKRVKRKKAS